MGAVPSASAGGSTDQLPNLVPLPPFDIVIGAPDGSRVPGGALRFAAAVANRGEYAFDLFARPQDPVGQTAAAEQCVGWATERICAARREVGRFIWHPEHGHHHFEDFAQYELRKLRPNGRPDMRRRGLVAGGAKVSFCLMDIEPDGGGGSGLFPLGYPLYTSSCAGVGFQGISAGWRDVYGNRTIGQQILLDDVPDGTYALLIRTDPEGHLLETTTADNVAVAGVELTDGASRVRVVCESDPGDTRCLPPR